MPTVRYCEAALYSQVLKAYKQGDDLMIEFTSALASTEGGPVVITLEETELPTLTPMETTRQTLRNHWDYRWQHKMFTAPTG